NTITGNLWGITIQANAQPNLGDISGEPSNPGMNQIYDNGNGGEVYDLYNDTPDPIMAQNNWWGNMDPDIVEMHIYHQVDDPSLGLVDFMPLFNPFTGMYENDVLENVALIECIYPNPAKSRFYIHLNHEMIPVGENVNLLISNINGQLLYKMDYEYEGRDIKVNLPDIDCELLTIRISANGFSDIKKQSRCGNSRHYIICIHINLPNKQG
nr:hypothetical protein [Bacteroidota bacterium]